MRSLIVAGLAVDVAVHWHLAPDFDSLTGSAAPHLSQGFLFRAESVLAFVAILLVAFRPRRSSAAIAFLVAAGGVVAVVVYRYVDVGAIGPLPDMYDASWYPEKSLSLIAEAIAALAALGWLRAFHQRRAVRP